MANYLLGGLITWFLMKNGVKEKKGVETINPMARICLASTHRSVGQLKKSEAPVQKEGSLSEELEADPQAPTSKRDGQSIDGLCELMREMQHRQEEMYSHLLQKQDTIFSKLQGIREEQKRLRDLVDSWAQD